jgi:hypothetical protein
MMKRGEVWRYTTPDSDNSWSEWSVVETRPMDGEVKVDLVLLLTQTGYKPGGKSTITLREEREHSHWKRVVGLARCGVCESPRPDDDYLCLPCREGLYE